MRRVSGNTSLTGLSIAAAAALSLAGCPRAGETLEFVAGGTGASSRIGTTASVAVLSPVTNLSIRGGTPVEVNWSVIATTNFAGVDVFFDVDQNPDNDNEIVVLRNVSLQESTAILDTTPLEAGTFQVGVALRERNILTAFDYSAGQIVVNQAARFFFDSPRDNFTFDRTIGITPRFDVDWTVSDPDSAISVDIFLDPDGTPNGNEFLLRESESQTGDSFTFDLPTAEFEPGTYRILAIVSDGIGQTAFYAPGSIVLLSRLAGVIDLRDLDTPGVLPGAIFEGFNPRDNAGSFVGSARDLDADGFDDLITMAQFGKPQYQANQAARTGVGEAYLIYGRPGRFTGRTSLNSTGTLFRGEIFGGPPEATDPIRPSRGITSFATLSDWDRDGLREFAFGVPFTDSLVVGSLGAGLDTLGTLDVNGYFRTGAVVVASSSVLRPDLGTPGRNVFNLAEFGTIPHAPFQETPCPEGFVGAKAPTSIVGYTLYHRHTSDFVGAPNSGSVRLGCRFTSNEFADQFGETISAGDFDSIVISVPNRDPLIGAFSTTASVEGAGTVSIYYCNVINGFFPWTTTQAAPAAGNWPGFELEGPTALIPHHGPYHYVVDDFRLFDTFVGPQLGSPGYYVDPEDSEPCVVLTDQDAPNPSRTTRIFGGFEGARIGNAVSIRDFNADGLGDILVGSPLSNDGAGSTFIVLGRLRNLVMAGDLAIEELGLPLSSSDDPFGARIFDGIRVVGAPGARLGQSQASAGDFNNDGIGDVVIGSPLVNNRRGGVAVFFGSREVINLTQVEIPFDEIPARGLGIVIEGVAEGDLAGTRVATAGDVDGDGNDDILIAAPNASVRLDVDLDGTLEIDRAECGVVYLVYGSAKLSGTLSLADIGTEKLPGAVFVGQDSGDHLGAGLGEQGDRANGIATAGDVDGDGRNDLLLGSVEATPRDRVRAGEVYLIYGQGE